jgi:glycosyltransferase involved in cell wall biosynthesis
MTKPALSLAVPVYNESACITVFINATTTLLGSHNIDYEIVFVDDGSQDNTASIIKQHAALNQKIKLIELSKNFGKHLTVCKAIENCSGEKIVYMDPDMQDPPHEIINLIDSLNNGYDIVYGIRKSKKDNFENSFFSKIFWMLLHIFGKYKFPKNMAVMRIFNSKFAIQFNALKNKGLFLEGMFLSIPLKVGYLEIEQAERFAGVSKFTFNKKLNILGRALCDASYFFMFIYFILFVLALTIILNQHNIQLYMWSGMALLLCLPFLMWHYKLLAYAKQFKYHSVVVKCTTNL